MAECAISIQPLTVSHRIGTNACRECPTDLNSIIGSPFQTSTDPFQLVVIFQRTVALVPVTP